MMTPSVRITRGLKTNVMHGSPRGARRKPLVPQGATISKHCPSKRTLLTCHPCCMSLALRSLKPSGTLGPSLFLCHQRVLNFAISVSAVVTRVCRSTVGLDYVGVLNVIATAETVAGTTVSPNATCATETISIHQIPSTTQYALSAI